MRNVQAVFLVPVLSVFGLSGLGCSESTLVDDDGGVLSDVLVSDTGEGDADGGEQDSGASDSGAADAGADTGPAQDTGPAPDVGLDVPTIPGPDAPNLPGPFAVTTQTSMAGDTPINVCIPGGVRAPLVIFAPGFMVASRFYEPTCQRLASHGFIVIRADPPSGFRTSHNAMRDSLVGVLDWALSESPFIAQIDPGRILVSGHSLGGKLATMVAAQDPRVTALFAIDPVDGGFGAPDVVPSLAMGLTIPVGFAGETTNGSGGFMPCAPAAENFQQFYAATTSAPWAAQWDFIGADHMDFVAAPAGCRFCGLCPAGSADPAIVIESMHTLFVAFARRHLGDDITMDPWLTGAQLPTGVAVTSR
ncbi:MAG: pimeloyl-ACP methyl ester carboxylesterase [Polyangiales bacterium]|jgi:pimeloyl-ACP methyl ester carboxylesterase